MDAKQFPLNVLFLFTHNSVHSMHESLADDQSTH